MKNLLCGILLIFTAHLVGQAQLNIPSAVLAAHQAKYPNQEPAFWELREGAMVAMFQTEGLLYKSFYEPNGEWRESRIRETLTGLPTEVQTYVAENFANANITYAGRVEKNNQTLYRIESELPNGVVIKLLNEKGQLIQEERIKFSLRTIGGL
jgi:hypothetical protein